MEDILDIVIKGDKMARERLQKIWERRDAKEREMDEKLEKIRVNRLSEAKKNLGLSIAAEKSKSEKMYLALERQTTEISDGIKKIFADSEHEWIEYVVSESLVI